MNTYQNPIKKNGDFADPFVLRYNGKYYLYGTNPDVRCWSSDDLVNWTLEGATVSEDEFPGLVPFAPEVVYWNGAFYMYTSPHGFGHYVLKSNSPTGPFRKITGNVGHSIDFSIFVDDDGQWYAYWADEKGIMGCKMSSPIEFGEGVNIGAYLHGWTEGPFVVKKDGKYHLTYTGNHFLSKGYRIHAAIADHPLGPYRDDPYNPVIICTEGNVVGLGHSSTVLGPDLHTHYIVYHNLNPDKTRDLNIDPIVFTPEKAYILGPTITPRPAPNLPQWRCERPALQDIQMQFAEQYIMPMAGVAEFNIAAAAGTRRYGLVFAGEEEIRLEFDADENNVSIRKHDMVLACGKIPSDYGHEALHSIRVEYDTSLTVYIDNLRLLATDAALDGCQVQYYADGVIKIGTSAVQPSGLIDLHYPIPSFAPGDRTIHFDTAFGGKYQFLALECRNSIGEIQIDGVPIMPDCADRTNSLAFYNCELDAGSHTLETGSSGARTIALAPHCSSGSSKLSVWQFGPFDKLCGAEKWTNTKIFAKLEVIDRREGWQAGVIFRCSHLADGGEGDDKLLGTNFFVGYRVCVTEDRIQLWKHRYNEQLLQEAPFKGGNTVSFQIVIAGNAISVSVDGAQVLAYQDPQPIMYGYSGFHARKCVIKDGTIY